MKPMLTSIVIAIICVALLAGSVFIYRLVEKGMETNTSSTSQTPPLSMEQKAKNLAEAELLTHFPDHMRGDEKLELIRAVPVEGTSSRWFIKYDTERSFGTSVEMIVDVETGTIVSYKDSWS